MRAALAGAVAAALAGSAATVSAAAQISVSGSGRTAAPCLAPQLRASIPDSIAGNPDPGMGQAMINVLLRNAGSASCSLLGWPALTVRGPGARPAGVGVREVGFDNLGPVRRQLVLLRPGQSAILTLIGPADGRGCLPRWSLDLVLGGSHLVAAPSAGLPAACLNGPLLLAPFSSLTALRSAIRALSVSASPSSYLTVQASVPAACTAPALAARVSSATSGSGGSLITLALSTTGAACALSSGGWPTVRLHLPGGADPVAKVFNYPPAWASGRQALTTYEHADSQRTVLTLRPGTWTPVVVLVPASGAGACALAGSVTIYPSAVALGAGRTIRLAAPVRACGQPRILPFLATGSVQRTLSLGGQALAAADIHRRPGAVPAGDTPAGFWYGSDGPTLMACGSAPPYQEASSADTTSQTNPDHPQCDSTDGNYGGYFGEVWKWDVWKGCDTDGNAWNKTNFDDANTNYNAPYNKGVGGMAYWMAAGPGRDPNYDGTESQAVTWGTNQAKSVVSTINSKSLVLPSGYVFMDIEQYTHKGQLDNGWNTVWTAECGGTGTPGIAASVDRGVFNGMWGYILNNSAFLPAVYSSGGSDSYEWDGIFGTSNDLYNTTEWTYNGEVSSISSFPSGWSVGNTSADFFASAPSACRDAWQWTGGSVHNTSDLRIDQLYGPNFFGTSACN